MSDDDDTPADSPRGKKSSVTVATADLLVERIALLLPPLSAEQRAGIADVLLDWVDRLRDALRVERREADLVRETLRVTEERLVAVQRELGATRTAMRTRT